MTARSATPVLAAPTVSALPPNYPTASRICARSVLPVSCSNMHVDRARRQRRGRSKTPLRRQHTQHPYQLVEVKTMLPVTLTTQLRVASPRVSLRWIWGYPLWQSPTTRLPHPNTQQSRRDYQQPAMAGTGILGSPSSGRSDTEDGTIPANIRWKRMPPFRVVMVTCPARSR